MTGVSDLESARSPEFVVIMSLICVIDDALCKVIMVVPLLIALSAVYTIVTMAIDIYRAVVNNIVMRRKTAMYAVSCIWALSVVVSSPQIYEYSVYLDHAANNDTFISCGPKGIEPHFQTGYALIVVFTAYRIPLGLVSSCYAVLGVYVYRHSTKLRTQINTLPTVASGSNATSQRNPTLSARMIKLVKMLTVLTITFLIMWTPYFVIFAITEITGLDDTAFFVEWPHVASRTMNLFSAVTNPILYLAFSGMFQDIVTNWFRCVRKADTRVIFLQNSHTRRSNINKVAPAYSMKPRALNARSLKNKE